MQGTRRVPRALLGGAGRLEHRQIVGAGARLQRQAVLGASLVLNVVAQRLVKREAVMALARGLGGCFAAQTLVFCERRIDPGAGQGADAGCFGARRGKPELTGAFAVLLRQSILAFGVGAPDRVAHQQRSGTIWRNAKLQAAVERDLVGACLRAMRLNGAHGQQWHGCPPSVRNASSSDAIDRDSAGQRILLTH
jgi:hypothetical protein